MFKNWKTTLLGLAGGGFQMLAGGTNWKTVLLALATAGIGAFAKDHDVTGVS